MAYYTEADLDRNHELLNDVGRLLIDHEQAIDKRLRGSTTADVMSLPP